MKQAILAAVINILEVELERLCHANAQSNAGAAYSAAGAEKQRDTTGFEAAYLARGYAIQCKSLFGQVAELKGFVLEDFSGQEIDIGALVEVEMNGEADCYLLLPCGGGTEVEVEGRHVTVITTESPLGKALVGQVEAGFVTLPSGREGIILDVC